MLENPVYPALPRDVRNDVYHGDNVPGAENQQERPIEFRGWVVGFVDGEGCFSIGFVRQPDRANRRGYKTGYQVSHRFAVTQGMKSVACLERLESFFGVGRISANRRHDNHREHLAQYVVDRRSDLITTIIPFFRAFPMLSAKQRDFEKFATCVELVQAGRHLEPVGLIEIAEIAQTMNRMKPRHDLIGILRGHTPDIRDIG
jgi:LAGLIDADG endonuclease